jgi:hypothetical protein
MPLSQGGSAGSNPVGATHQQQVTGPIAGCGGQVLIVCRAECGQDRPSRSGIGPHGSGALVIQVRERRGQFELRQASGHRGVPVRPHWPDLATKSCWAHAALHPAEAIALREADSVLPAKGWGFGLRQRSSSTARRPSRPPSATERGAQPAERRRQAVHDTAVAASEVNRLAGARRRGCQVRAWPRSARGRPRRARC